MPLISRKWVRAWMYTMVGSCGAGNQQLPTHWFYRHYVYGNVALHKHHNIEVQLIRHVRFMCCMCYWKTRHADCNCLLPSPRKPESHTRIHTRKYNFSKKKSLFWQKNHRNDSHTNIKAEWHMWISKTNKKDDFVGYYMRCPLTGSITKCLAGIHICHEPCFTFSPDIQYIPRNMHTVLLCFALLWLCNRS